MSEPTPPTGTIDITNLVGAVKDTWVRWATNLATTAARNAMPFLAWPVFSQLLDYIVGKIVETIADGIEMQGFFLNTALRKASQARDYVDANTALKALPSTATDEEYENAEKAEMLAFRNFVLLSN